MALSVINFAALPPSGQGTGASILEGLQRGLGAGADFAALRQKLKSQKLQDKLAQLDLQYGPRMKEAEIKKMEALASLPFGGATLPGSAGQILALESIRQMFGDQSPQYQSALNDFNLQQESDKARINYQNVLSQTAPTRALTPTGRQIVEQTNVAGGFSPTGALRAQNMPSPERLRNLYELKQLKETTDPQARARNLFATNIEKTLGQIDPSLFAKYSGAYGKSREALESLLSPLGFESPEFDQYKQAEKASELLASQIRQFYGESIQPSLRDELKTLTNPTSWRNSPKQTLQLFNKTKNILGQEMQTLRDALGSRSAYEGGEPLEFNPTPKQVKALVESGQAEIPEGATRAIKGKEYIYRNGKWYLP